MSSAVAQLSEISRLHLFRPERQAGRPGRPRAPASGLPDLARVLSNVRERRLDFVIKLHQSKDGSVRFLQSADGGVNGYRPVASTAKHVAY